ncbi:MAG: lysylphosphatidylglycerol synthase transmembrane domain-containing protein [Bacteroidota bacterium]
MNALRKKTTKLKGRRKLSPFLLIRLLGIALFIFILTTVDLSSLWKNISEVKADFLIYGIFFQLLLLFLKAFRWHILNSGSKESNVLIRSLGEFFESYAIGVITPGRMGEMMKAGHAKEKNSMMEAGIRVLVERGFDLGIFVLIAGLSLMITFRENTAMLIGILVILAGVIILSLAVIFMRSASATAIIEKLVNRLPFMKLDLQLSFRKRSPLVQMAIIFLSVASNLSYFISCYFLALGLLFDHGFLFVSGAVAIAGLLNMLPVTVMGLGTREGTFLLLFKPLAEPLILAFSGLVFLVAQIGGGVVALILGQVFLNLSVKDDSGK